MTNRTMDYLKLLSIYVSVVLYQLVLAWIANCTGRNVPIVNGTQKLVDANSPLVTIRSTPWRIYCNAMKKYMNASHSNEHRLTAVATPIRYKVRLRLDTERKRLYGHVLINIRIHNKTNLIEMNAIKLKIISATFRTGLIRVDANMIYHCPEQESIVLHFPKYLHKGAANLTINFLSNLTEQWQYGSLRTFYENGQRIIMLDYGPNDARRQFPCWDEPRYKATFDLYMIIPKNSMAISNMDIIRRRPYSQYLEEIKFNRTPAMSTYQLSVLIAPKLNLINVTDGKIRLITSNPADQSQWTFAVETSQFLLNYYEYYFDKAYPLDRLNLVVLKHYTHTSLEKLGLIYFSQWQLSVKTNETNERQLQDVASSLAHSISHQWFGSSVTFNHWSDFWLFESLNQFMEKQALDDVFPQWRTWQQFTANEMGQAMQLDASIYAQAVSSNVLNNANYQLAMNNQIYRKMTFLLKMLKSNIDQDIFQRALQIFLFDHWNQTATVRDLWSSFMKAINQNSKRFNREIVQFMEDNVQLISNWTELAGLPVLHVQEQQRAESRVLTIKQERFIELRSNNVSHRNSKDVWPIPVSIIHQFNPFTPSNKAIIREQEIKLIIPEIWDGVWIKLNAHYGNFYRVHYSDEVLYRFTVSIEEKLLPVLDRLNLIDDLFAMARAGYTSTSTLLKIIWSYQKEDNPNIWSVIIAGLNEIHSLIDNMGNSTQHQADSSGSYDRLEMLDKFNFYRQMLFKRMYNLIGWYDRSRVQSIAGYQMKIAQIAQAQLRENILCAIQHAREANFVEQAKLKYLDYLNGQSDLPLEILQCVFRAYGSFSQQTKPDHLNTSNVDEENQFHLQHLFKYYNDYDLPEARHLFSIAIGCATDSAQQIKQVLEFALKSTVVRTQDSRTILTELARCSRMGRNQLLADIQRNPSDFFGKFSTLNELYEFFRDLLATFSKRSQLDILDKLFVNHSSTLQALMQALRYDLEKVQVREQWFYRDGQQIGQFLTQFKNTINHQHQPDITNEDYWLKHDHNANHSSDDEHDSFMDYDYDNTSNHNTDHQKEPFSDEIISEISDNNFFVFEDNFDDLIRRRRESIDTIDTIKKQRNSI